ncbi:reverse transcriptase domain-containing protein [Tanacetum coccineum]
MADNRTMAQMLQAPIEGYEDAIVVPPINANNFELKQPLINLVQSNKFTGRQDPHNHLRFFNKVTSTFRHPEVPNTSVKLLLFPFSLDGEARDWLDKEPPRSILTWDDLVSKFINQYFPPSKTTYYRNEIITFYQKPNEAFNEAWERFKGLLRQSGGQYLDKMPQEGLAIIESKSKVRYSRSRANDSRVSTDAPLSNSSPSNNSFDMQQIAASLEDKMTIKMNKMLNEMKALVVTTPAPVKAVEEVCVTCGSNHNFNHCPLTEQSQSSFKFKYSYRAIPIQNPKASKPGNKTRSGVSYEGPSIPMPPPFVNPDVVEKTSTEHVPPPLTQKVQETNSQTTTKVNQEGIVNNPKTYELKLPYPERRNVEKRQEKDKVQLQKFWKMFKQLHFNISLADALILMPKYTKMLKDLCANKEKLEELANTPLSENCLADLGASINLMPLSVFHRLGFTNLESTQMTLELANRQLCRPDGICKDVLVPSHYSSSSMKTSDNLEKFADELAPLDSLPPGNDDSSLKKDCHEETFQVYSNPLFEFDDNFKSSNVNPLFEENDKDVKINSSSSFTLTSPEESKFEAYLEKDSIPPGIDLTLPPTLAVSSSNPTSPTLTGEKVCSWKTPMFFSLVRFV